MTKIIAVVLVILLALSAGAATLRDVYQSGTITISADLKIEADSLPDDMVMQRPGGYDFLPDGSILVSDFKQNVIFKFSSKGEFVQKMGQPGQGPGDLMMPTKVVANMECFVVWELINRRFSIFKHDGTFLRHHKFSNTTYITPEKIVSLGERGFLMHYTRYDRDDNGTRQVAVIQLMSKDLENGKVMVEHPLNINKFINKGKVFMNVPQPFAANVSWDMAAPDCFVLGFQDPYLLQVMNLAGKEVCVIRRKSRPVPISNKEKEEFFNTIHYQGIDKKEIMPILRSNVKFPDHKPYYNRVIVDPEGNILVFPSHKQGDETEDCFDAFTSKGEFIQRVNIQGAEKEFWSLRFHDGKLWSLSRDEEEEPVLIRHTWGG